MAELAEFLASFALSQADKDAARKQALMMAGLGLLGAKKGREAEAMGRAGLLGMDAYQQGLTGAQQGKVDQYKMAEVWRKQKEAEEAAKAQAADVAAVEQAKQSPWQAAAPWLSATGPVPKDSDAERYQRMALATKNPANAKIYGELADKIAEKFGAPTVGMVGGKPSYARFGDKGGSQIVPGIVPPPDSQIVDLGGQKRVIDKLTTAPGTTFDVTMDPAQIAAAKNADERLGIDRSRLGLEHARFGLSKQEFEAKLAAEKAALANPKPKAAPEAYLKQSAGITNLNTAIDEYVKELGSWSNLSMANPDALANMGTKYNNMMLQAKEAYNLGVLNGPDYMILTQTITNPVSMKGAITSNAALAKQAQTLREIMSKNQANLDTVYKQAPIQQPAGQSASGVIDFSQLPKGR